MRTDYLLLRLIRHFLPESMARFLLRQRLIIKPGLESSDPEAAVQRYLTVLSEHNRALEGQRVLVFGYGGRFAVGVELLNRGAAHVILCDRIKSLDNNRNLELIYHHGKYLVEENGVVNPRAEFITLVHGDIREPSIQKAVPETDIVVSTSVFEHLEDVPVITKALAELTESEGFHLHFIDLRDHFFKYPFEMLTFSDLTWKYLLNPSSNLNRMRVYDYQNHFHKYFKAVKIKILEKDPLLFEQMRKRIRPEFIHGELEFDSTLQIQLTAEHPIRLDIQ